jgi:hypothetical protein
MKNKRFLFANPTRPCTFRRKTNSIIPTDEGEQMWKPGRTIQNTCLLGEWVWGTRHDQNTAKAVPFAQAMAWRYQERDPRRERFA